MEENVNVEASPVTIRSAGIKYGLYAGLVSISVFLITSLLGYNPFGGGLNYIGVVASIILLVLAHKEFKDSGDGFMGYGQGFAIGFWCTLVSVILSLGVTYLYINFYDYSPMQLFMEDQATKMQEAGTPDSTIETAQEWTKKLFWVIGLVGAIIWGLVIALIVTIFTQKKNPQGEMA